LTSIPPALGRGYDGGMIDLRIVSYVALAAAVVVLLMGQPMLAAKQVGVAAFCFALWWVSRDETIQFLRRKRAEWRKRGLPDA
jgi:Flp pilus assembly protein TadB